jgi:hypothetical protein
LTRQIHPLLILTVLLTAFAACSGPSARNEDRLAELRSQRRSIILQFSSAQQAIRRIQGQALAEPGVRAAQEAFNAEMRTAVARDDPESLELLDRARVVGHDLQSMATPLLLQQGEEDPRPTDPEERVQVAAELADVERKLRPVIDRAFQDSAVAVTFAALRDSVVTAMLRIDPESKRTIDLMADLEARAADIDAEIARLSQ